MSDYEASLNTKSPRFMEAMQKFQTGLWEQGLFILRELSGNEPDDPEMLQIMQEMEVRSTLDEYEKEDHKLANRRLAIKWSASLVSAVVVFFLFFWGYVSYSNYLQQHISTLSSTYEKESGSITLAIKYRNAQDLLNAGNNDEALALLNEVAAEDPNLPGLQDAIALANSNIELGHEYDQAVGLMEEGNYIAALSMFKKIQEKSPLYKDVSLRVNDITHLVKVDSLMADADKAYQEKNWLTSITGYETIRSLDPNYKTAVVEENLFQAYLNHADEILALPGATLDTMQIAEGYYSKALALKPQDSVALQRRAQARSMLQETVVNSYLQLAEQALTEQPDSLSAQKAAEVYFDKALAIRPNDAAILLRKDLARRFLAAEANYTRGLWTDVINDLEIVYKEDAGYASGTARQTLYEAYMARGRDEQIGGNYAFALNDFQRAAVLSQGNPDLQLLLFEAQVMGAETMGLLGNYKDAVMLYRNAVDQAGILNLATSSDKATAVKLTTAEEYVNAENYSSAYVAYRDSLKDIKVLLNSSTHVVQSGEYLTMLARRYNTTVRSIMQANGISERGEIPTDHVIVIPILP